MVFSSLLFLFWFIPIFFAVYYVTPMRFRNAVLFAGSIVFYAWGEPKYLLLIFASIIVNYLGGRMLAASRLRRGADSHAPRIWMIATLIFDFGMLFLFKYTDFFIDNINSLFNANISHVGFTLPLGISFYTFQIASYIIDLYRGRIEEERNILNLATYLVMFPQLIAGPIVIYSQVSDELGNRRITLEDIEEGIGVFTIGLASKVLIANNVGALWNDIGGIGFENISMPLAWMGVLAYTLQIYFDFNGYSLMAIGLGKMLGFNIPRNFNHPYISLSLTEFWRRWHITLSGWFKDYLYIPLGGNRKGRARTYLNLFIVWFATGFWHGAGWNFILWGLFFFVMLSAEKSFLAKFLDNHKVFARIYSVLLISLSWMIFAITDMHEMGVFFGRLVSFTKGADAIYYLRNYAVLLCLGCVLSTPLLSDVWAKIKHKWYGVVITLLLLAVSIAYLTDAAYNPFLYFRF